VSTTSYHHGNLSQALEDAATDLARAGGPEAVVLREAARRAGVSATAAYRHFAGQQDLLERVKQRALGVLAERIGAALALIPRDGDATDAAVARLFAAGRAYVDFARTEPGYFATAFRRTGAEAAEGGSADPEHSELGDDTAFRMLGTILDGLVSSGVMPADDRPHAEYAAWSAVHGLAVLLLDGPLRHMEPADQDAAVERTLRLVVDGLTSGRAMPDAPTGSAAPDPG
jgi:AcrR family transcriptional regulator